MASRSIPSTPWQAYARTDGLMPTHHPVLRGEGGASTVASNPLPLRPASGKVLPRWVEGGVPSASSTSASDPLGTPPKRRIDHCRLQPPFPFVPPLGRSSRLGSKGVYRAHPAPSPPTPLAAHPAPPPPTPSALLQSAGSSTPPKRLIEHSSKAPHRALSPPTPFAFGILAGTCHLSVLSTTL